MNPSVITKKQHINFTECFSVLYCPTIIDYCFLISDHDHLSVIDYKLWTMTGLFPRFIVFKHFIRRVIKPNTSNKNIHIFEKDKLRLNN